MAFAPINGLKEMANWGEITSINGLKYMVNCGENTHTNSFWGKMTSNL